MEELPKPDLRPESYQPFRVIGPGKPRKQSKLLLILLIATGVLAMLIAGFFVLQPINRYSPTSGQVETASQTNSFSNTSNSNQSSTNTQTVNESPTNQENSNTSTDNTNGTSSADADRDGLTDNDEVTIGTDPANSDSDGDTYRDGLEVRNGFNPLGPGPATEEQKQVFASITPLGEPPIITSASFSTENGRTNASWTTSPATSAVFVYGQQGAQETQIEDANDTTSHSFVLSVVPGQTYFYRATFCTEPPDPGCTTTPDKTFVAK